MADKVVVSGADKTTDPSAMTRESMDREFGQVREIITTGLAGLSQIITQRLDAVDERDKIREEHRGEIRDLNEVHRIEIAEAANRALSDTLAADKLRLSEQKIADDKINAERQANIKELVQANDRTSGAKFDALAEGLADAKNDITILKSMRQGGNDMRTTIIAVGGLALVIASFLAGKG